jgi:Glycosyl hydrolase 2 galactose-binding domain-like/Exo-beta-D-glucosaminidase Ig-fold domain/Malectin domain/Glycosyl hydrolases family 2/Glycosyl hydrolases family 2, TIM barrel domain
MLMSVLVSTCFRRAALLPLCALTLQMAVAASSQGWPAPVRLDSGWVLQDAAKVPQTGDAISKTDFDSTGWHEATVPGTVLTSLVNDGVYPEPLYGLNNLQIPDTLCRTPWWYRTSFTPPATYAGKQIWLTFNGINFSADVWVNGHQVGTIKGAFARGIFNVTPYVVIGKPNALAVLIQPQPHPGVAHQKTIATGTGRNGGVTATDGPTFLCAIGWDWIPTIRDRDSGIWQDVTLSASGPVVVQNPYVTSKLPLPRTDSADLTVQATVSNVTDTTQAGVLNGDIARIQFKQEFSLAPHETRTLTFSPATTSSLHLRHPRLWWPNGYGPQNLYTLHLTASVKGEISDAQDVKFGVRQITYQLPGSDNLALSVNGVPVVAKGGDWGMDEAMKRIPRKRLDAMVRMHQLANYTIIRNWVGQSTSDDFYEMCDKYGILVWDEFFQPNPADGPNPDDPEVYLANVREKILRFRNHPCIALWCARNEGNPPPQIGEGIQKLINALDPDRLYQPSSTSGRGVHSSGPYHWRTPREFYNFKYPFKTEIGSMSVPTLEAIHAMMPAKDWNVINDDWAEHDFCAGAQQGNVYPDIITRRYGPIASLPDFVRKAQLANYEAFRALYEGRFVKLFRPVTGVITWMSNPAQPSFVWQLYSHDLEPNASLFATREACEPVHVMMNQSNWHVAVINNTPHPLDNLAVKTEIYSLNGALQSNQTHELTVAASAATDTGAIAFPGGLPAVYFVRLELRDARHRLLSDNFYWRAAPEHPDDFQALNQMPLVALDVQAKQHEAGGKCLIQVTLHNPARSIALMAHLQLRKADSGQRVLPVFYSDNYVSLVPGERKTLTVEANVSDLGGGKPLLAVDGWNVTVNPVSSAGNSLAVVPNTEALVPMPVSEPSNEPTEIQGINCGGGSFEFFHFGARPPEFGNDRDFKGGRTTTGTNDIDTQVANAAPAAVYQTERWGNCTYTLPVVAGHLYTVRLHFAENRFSPGGREFNVDINGRRVLHNFDIAAEAGKDKALVKDFPSVAPDDDGHIVIAFRRGAADEPKVCGIQVIRQ